MSNNLLETIKSQGYWHIIIRPLVFQKERINKLSEIVSLVEKNSVRFRGWDFPHLQRNELIYGVDYIETSASFMEINETWRFYQSGQFAWFMGLTEDWHDDSIKSTFNGKSGAYLSIISTLYQLTEIYEFAARLAQHNLFEEGLHITIKIVGTKDRELFFWPNSGRWLRANYICTVEELSRKDTYKVIDIIGRSGEYSFQHFQWLMERFGFDASQEVFKIDQEKFFEGRF